MTSWVVGRARVEIVCGDLCLEETDAIVNAANESLLGGGGVDGAIHRAGGPAILAACRELGGCATGDAKITVGGDLRARFVIHTVGPIYGGTGEDGRLLASCHRRSLEVAGDRALVSVAFPAISCGVYGYPVVEAAPIALGTTCEFLRGDTTLRLVRFVLFTVEVADAFAVALGDVSG